MIYDPLRSDGFFHLAIPSLYSPGLAPPGCVAAFITTLAPFATKEFWDANRSVIQRNVIARVEKAIPGFSENIVYVENSTPHTILRYTGNTKGANYGFAMNKEQSGFKRLAQKTKIKNLYLAGHWTRPGCGLATVANSGYTAANLIINNRKRMQV
jgi:prolycopene isomerase